MTLNAPPKDAAWDDAIAIAAQSIGFDGVGFCDAAISDERLERLTHYLDAGRHGDMAWMETRITERANPKSLWPDTSSVIMLTMNYGPAINPMEKLSAKSNANISVYAGNLDYHDVIKKKLKQLARWLIAHYGGEVKVFVDTAPVMEKPLANEAGLGWQGKHTNLVSREYGSWLFLGAIFTTLKTSLSNADSVPHTDHCGACTQCLDACPTDAFPAPYQLDARRCISYLTIEHKGPIPQEFRAAMGNRIYGCDDCLAVCPWNKFASEASQTAFHARQTLKSPKLADLLDLDDPAFRALFSKSPVKRIGRDRFIRNVLIAAGNSGDQTLLPQIEHLRSDPDPVVQDAANWASITLQQ